MHTRTLKELSDFMGQEQVNMLVYNARTMIMMYKATKYKRYLTQAKLDIKLAKSILRSGYMSPFGTLLMSA